MRQFLINNTIVKVSESNIERYYHLGDECHHKLGTQLHRYEGDLFISESGKIVDSEAADNLIPQNIFCDEGKAITHHKDFFNLDALEAFIYYNKLIFIDTLEEVYD